MPKTDHELAIYHYSHSRCQKVLGRIEMMLSCRDTGKYMFYAREGIRYLCMERMATELDFDAYRVIAKYSIAADENSAEARRQRWE